MCEVVNGVTWTPAHAIKVGMHLHCWGSWFKIHKISGGCGYVNMYYYDTDINDNRRVSGATTSEWIVYEFQTPKVQEESKAGLPES